jgi:PAS domain S-box-containing protein
MKLPIERRILSASVILIIGVIALVTVLSLHQVKKVDLTTKSLIQNQDILLSIQQLTSLNIHYDIIANASVIDESEIKHHKEAIAEKISDLNKIEIDNAAEKKIVDSFIYLIRQSASFSDEIIQAKRTAKLKKADELKYLSTRKEKINAVKAISDQLTDLENFQQITDERESIKGIKSLKIIFYTCLFAVVITTIFIVRRIQIDLIYQKRINSRLSYMAALINHSEDAIISLKDGIIQTWNKGAEKIYGYSKQEVIGKDRDHVMRPQLSESERIHILKTTEETGKWQGEIMHTNKNGEQICLLLSVTKIVNESPIPIYVLIAKNITQKKKDEEKILLLGTMLDNCNDAIITINNEGNIASWNNGATNLYGYAAAEAIGKFEPDFLAANPQYALDIFSQIKDNPIGSPWQGECLHKTKDGTHKNVALSITVVQNLVSGNNDYVCIITDITAKKKAEEDSNKLAEVLQTTDDAVFITTKQTNITSWNKGAEKLYGYTAKEALGNRSIDLLKVSNPLIDFKSFDFSKDAHVRKESIHYNKKGEEIIVEVSLSYKTKSSTDGYFLIIVSDITEKKRSEDKIKRLASIIQLSNDAIYTTDTEFRIIGWNQGAEKMYGYTEEEMLGKIEYKILPAYHPVFTEKEAKSTEEIGYFKAESTHRKKNGEVFIVGISISHIRDEKNNTTGYIIITNDITDVKKLEGQLKNFNEQLEAEVSAKTKELNDVFGRVTDAFIAVNNQHQLTYVNKKAGEILQRNWKDLVGKDLKTELKNIDENFFKVYEKAKEKQEYIYFEDYFKSFNSWIEIHFYPSSNGVSIYFKDVTHQKKIQEDLIKLNYRFRNLASHLQNSREEERINIAREIHDELGQMATALKIDLSWIKKKMVSESEDVREKVDNTIAELGEMVNTIRRIAQELRPSILDNLGLTAAIEWYCGDFQKRTGIQCKFANGLGDVQLPNNVKTSLFRICQESLTNVMRHSEATEVACSMKWEKSNKIVLTIEDNGKGFDTSQKTKSLGLLGMQERALLINGVLKIESKPKQGTIITVEVDI